MRPGPGAVASGTGVERGTGVDVGARSGVAAVVVEAACGVVEASGSEPVLPPRQALSSTASVTMLAITMLPVRL